MENLQKKKQLLKAMQKGDSYTVKKLTKELSIEDLKSRYLSFMGRLSNGLLTAKEKDAGGLFFTAGLIVSSHTEEGTPQFYEELHKQIQRMR